MDTRKIALLFALVTAGVAGCTAAQPVAQIPASAGKTGGALGPDVLQNGNKGGFVTFIKKTNSPAGTVRPA